MSDRRLPGADLRAVLRPAIPTSIVRAGARGAPDPGPRRSPSALVVDLGCGRGDSVDAFRAADPERALDRRRGRRLGVRDAPGRRAAASSTASRCRSRTRASTSSSPSRCSSTSSARTSSSPTSRACCKPGGVFAGSTSHLEPYHGRSTMNLTPYGLKLLVERSGHRAGGDDARGSTRRRCSCAGCCAARHSSTATGRAARRSTRWSTASRASTGWDAEDRNAIKLLFSGQYAFVARRPARARLKPDEAAVARRAAAVIDARDRRAPRPARAGAGSRGRSRRCARSARRWRRRSAARGRAARTAGTRRR